MLIHDKKHFVRGLLLLASFAAVFVAILSPIFPAEGGGKVNGLGYADDLFNKLAKGSSNFLPDVRSKAEGYTGKQVDLQFALKKPRHQALAVQLATAAGLTASPVGEAEVKLTGDLGRLLAAIVEDSDAMYHNRAEALQARYQHDGKQVMEAWWELLQAARKAMMKTDLVAEASAVDLTMRKAIEPAYNFYGIEAQKISDRIPVAGGLLVFYVLYTLWYGFAIFEIFTGLGLAMKKPKLKKEV